ncbi:MAG: HEAT repeat domain-containing protein [Bacteroidota bacterium]
MIHSRYRRLLSLHLYGELTAGQEGSLHHHLESCPGCRSELEKLKALRSLLDAERSSEPTEELLDEMRQKLSTSLRGARVKRPMWDSLRSVFSTASSPRYSYALGLIAAFTLGGFLGHQLFVPARVNVSPLASWGPERLVRESVAGNLRIAGLRFVETAGSPAQVVFALESVIPTRLKGAVEDPEIQKLLAYTLANERNPGVRLRAVNAIAPRARIATDREVKAALILALKNDDNAGVRSSALRALTHYPYDQEIRDAFLLAVLYDENPGVRISAINSLDTLSRHGMTNDQTVLDVLNRTLQHDSNDYIRMKAQSLIQEARQQ